MGRTIRTAAAAFLTAGAALAAATAVAWGSGSPSLAAAPAIQAGVAQTGDTTVDRTGVGDDGIGLASGCWHDAEFWKIDLAAGDDVVIKGGASGSGENLLVAVFPPGTTAANIASARAVRYGPPLSKALEFVAPSTGTYPVVAGPSCYNGADGPFAFTFAVTKGAGPQAATVKLPKAKTVSRSGSLTATVLSAGGSPVTDPGFVLMLYGTWGGASHVLASAAPKNGSARFTFRLPASAAGTRVQLRVKGSGGGYEAAATPPLTVVVTG